MDSSSTVECAGHPRDMGLAQGEALRGVIRGEVERRGLATRRSRWPSLRPLVSGPLRGKGAGRELFRHFAHQAERLEGLARGADLPLDSLLALQLADRSSGVGSALGAASDAAVFIVRESRPVVGFRSFELTLPWLVAALAGINDAGLALTTTGAGGTPRDGADGVPPVFLVQDCLARFSDLAGGIDWCRKRPVAGRLVLEFADASGAQGRVVVAGRERHWERIEGTADGADPVLEGVLADPARPGPACRVRLEPRSRRLRCEGVARADGSSSFEGVLPLHVAPPLH